MATVPHLTLVTKSNVGSPCWLRGFLWPNVSLSERRVAFLLWVPTTCWTCVAFALPLAFALLLRCVGLCSVAFCASVVISFLPVGERLTTRHWKREVVAPINLSIVYTYVCIPTTCGVELSTGHTVSPQFWTTETCFSISFWPGKTRFYVCFWCVCVFPSKTPFFSNFRKTPFCHTCKAPWTGHSHCAELCIWFLGARAYSGTWIGVVCAWRASHFSPLRDFSAVAPVRGRALTYLYTERFTTRHWKREVVVPINLSIV